MTALVEDPPWVLRNRAKFRDFDYIGLGCIALCFGSFQIMLDRGEDEDWFGSPLIRVCAVLGTVGLIGAITWLLTTKKPIVNLRVFGNSQLCRRFDDDIRHGRYFVFGFGG